MKIFGFELSKAGEFVKFCADINDEKSRSIMAIKSEIRELESKKAEVVAIQAQRGTLQQDIDSLKKSYSREHSKLKRAEERRAELATEISALESRLEMSESTSKGLEQKLSSNRDNLTKIEKDILESTGRLTELQSSIGLFPSEIAGFARQGWKDFRIFGALSIIPLILLVTMFCMLIRGAADLTTKITGSEYINIAALVASRTPYVLVSTAIITVCYYVIRLLVLEMVRISRQRLALTKISIIAKDISLSIERGLDLTAQEIYENRLSLKMRMMQDHLKHYIGSDVDPELPQRLNPADLASSTPSL